jgi:hypothetical protein
MTMPSLRDRVKKGREQSSPSKNDKAAAFIGAADERAAASPLPWDAYDKKAVPRTTFNLRLNDYELALLRHLAAQRDESMQKVAKRTLIPVLEQLVQEGRR